jgi:hypothetical protein
VIPIVLVFLGLLALASGAIALSSFGSGLRIGRLLATTPRVSIVAARELALSGRPAYVRIEGRIDSDTSFEDSAHRPLVLRRTRVQIRHGREWTTVEDGRETVPFDLREGLDAIEVDGPALGDGLVVVPRDSSGRVADLIDRVPLGTDAGLSARVRIDQISAVEHAIALGVPVQDDPGPVRLTAGLGRPLILTTLEQNEAMRVLAGGRRRRAIVAAGLLASGAVLVLLGAAVGIGGSILATAAR